MGCGAGFGKSGPVRGGYSGRTRVIVRGTVGLVGTELEKRRKYVDVVIYHMYVWSFWKIILLRRKSSLGNLKIRTDNCVPAVDPACNGGRRTDLHSIAGTSCYWSCRTDRIESISREKAVNL